MKHIYQGGWISFRMPAIIDLERCVSCAKCVIACRYGGMKMRKVEGHKKRKAQATEDCCDCHFCVGMCPEDAIEMHTHADMLKEEHR